MLPTLVIGLREGLEAALIVGIIAAFLRKNGKSLVPMWVGVVVAVLLSIAVGIALDAIEQALPQAAQEGMESIIGVVAVIFVTGMIVWMNTHSRGLKHQLEAEAGEAIRDGHAYALAGMAFLAVLKEGFETSVFLLATFSASGSAALAATGAVIGVVAAVLIGVGIYAGSVRLNLSTFFRWTGGFLILVAAGLVLQALRTAHEAGWINAGQQQLLDLSAIARPGSVISALLTGVLGIPTDPRLIEVVGWLCYLVPVALFVYWPRARRATGMRVAHVQFGIAGAVALVAIGLAAFFPRVGAPQVGALAIAEPLAHASGTAELQGTTLHYALGGTNTTVHLTGPGASEQHNGVAARHWQLPLSHTGVQAPATLTLDQLAATNGNRLPIGINPTQESGPFDASWSIAGNLDVWAADGALIDAQQNAHTVVTLSGGGLTTPRTITIDQADFIVPAWAATDRATQAATNAVEQTSVAHTERLLWAVQLPIALGVAALLIAAFGLSTRRRVLAAQTVPTGPETLRSTAYAAN